MFGRKKKEVAEVKEVGPDYSAFDEAVKSGKTDEAASIGSYLLNQNPKNVDFYKRFFDWILKMALESKDPLIKEGYYGLANDVCSSFNMLMDRTPANITLVAECRKKLNERGLDYGSFFEAIESNKTEEAVIIGSNLLNQNPKNVDFFKRFFNWICDMAKNSGDLLTKEGYYGLANDACSSFTLLMELTPENIKLVAECRKKLNDVQRDRFEAQMKIENENRERILEHNKELLERIKKEENAIDQCVTTDDLETRSKNIVNMDREFNREFLPYIQDEYDDLMKEVSDKISERSITLTKQINLEINQEAVETYKSILSEFHKNESIYTKKDAAINGFYKTIDQALIYSENELFPETMAYYSYVYNYILSALQEKQKYELTLHMIKAKGDVKK